MAVEWVFNADSLFAPALFRDLFLDGGSPRAWSFPPPGFLPDLAVYFVFHGLALAVGLDYHFAVLVFGFAQFVALCAGMVFFLIGATPVGRFRRGYFAAAVAALFMVFVAAATQERFAFLPFLLIHHGSAMALALWAGGCLVRGRWKSLAVLSAIGTFGDVLFFGFCVFPALLAMIVAPPARIAKRDRTRALLICFLSAGLGRLLFGFVRATDLFLLPALPVGSLVGELATLDAFAARLGDSMLKLLVQVPPWYWPLFIVGVLSMRPSIGDPGRRTGVVFALASAVIGLGLGFAGAVSQNQNEPAARYMQPALVFFPLYISWSIFRSLPWKWKPVWVPPVSLLAAGVVGILLGAPTRGTETDVAGVGACLAQQQRMVRDGLAGYAVAGPANLRRRADGSSYRINAIDGGAGIRYWLNSAAWYGPGPDDSGARTPRYDFILTRGLDEEMLRDRFGSPEWIVACPGTDVWLYDAPIEVFGPGEIRLWRTLIGR